MNNNYTKRLEYLIDEAGIKKLNDAKVMICGCGGVGSFVAEALSRSGIGMLYLVDFDTIEDSNLNRQLMTNKHNIGNHKAYELKKHLEDISDTHVVVIEKFIDKDFVIPNDIDYLVDCIDTLIAKFELVKKCNDANIGYLSSLGSAKRLSPNGIKYTTLDKTRNDPLAKAFRNLVKKEGFKKKIDVVFVDSPPIQKEITQDGKTRKERHPLGSSIFTVGSVGLYIAYVVCMKIMETKR